MTKPVTLSSRATHAKVERETKSTKIKAALQRRKDQGVRLGNPTNFDVAQKNGAAANKARSQRKIAEIADALADIDDSDSMTARAVASALNERGIQTGRGKPWTISAIRDPLRKARELLKQRNDDELARDPRWGSW